MNDAMIAVSGASGVHISLSGGANPESLERIEHQGTARIERFAREEAVRRITYLSGMYVGHPAAESRADRESKARRRRSARAVYLTRSSNGSGAGTGTEDHKTQN